MRIRSIKPEFFSDGKLGSLSAEIRILFVGLWCCADREGRLIDIPIEIKVKILPYDTCNIDTMLDELNEKNLIIRYKVNNCNYIQITNFLKHQYPNIKERASTIPAPCLHDTSTPLLERERTGKESAGMVQAPCSKKSPVGDPASPEVKTQTPCDQWQTPEEYEKRTTRKS